MLLSYNGTPVESSGVSRTAQLHRSKALAAFADRPGDLDITWGKIGDRWGFVVSMAHPEDLILNISSPLIKCRAGAIYYSKINSDQYFVDGSTAELVEEFGISRQMMRGRTITTP